MPPELVVPPCIEAVIQEFDRSNVLFAELDVQQALCGARSSLQNPSEAENLGAWTEILAFALSGPAIGDNPWGTFFGPISSATHNDGKKVYFPNIADADAQVIAHWSERATSIQHPVLKARYADLVWEMCRVIAGCSRREPAMARLAIDAYLESFPLRTEAYRKFEVAIRALDLASLIHDSARTERAKTALFELHRGMIAARTGPWWYAFDRLIDDKRAGVTNDERQQLVSDLEALSVYYSNFSKPGVFDPYKVEEVAKRLIKYYTRLGQLDDIRRLNEVIARGYEHAANLANAMVASPFLQTAVNAYRQAGLRDESQRARLLMEEKIAQAGNETNTIQEEISIPHEEIQGFVDSIVVADLGSTFAKIAWYLLPNQSEIEEQIRIGSEEAPIQAIMPIHLIADDHVAGVIGSVENDPYGRLLHETRINFWLSGIWLQVALKRTIEAHDAIPEHFVGWANRLSLFDDLTFLIEGTKAFYAGDLVKAVHVLVPQIESGLRSMVGQLGKPVTKAHSTVADVSVALGMGDILNSDELKQALGPDLVLYFNALYADPRGMNLRNRVAHGLIKPENIDPSVAQWLIHTLLVFGLWKELAEKRH
ncbi:MAG: DUF4209 domain-containing protein [Rhodospirillales bacterium]